MRSRGPCPLGGVAIAPRALIEGDGGYKGVAMTGCKWYENMAQALGLFTA